MSTDQAPVHTAAIIGAGFSGIAMGIALKRAGIDSFVIFEKSGGLAGTWWDNTYPGAGCDVPSHLYSYSFAPNPDWSLAYSLQGEIRDYVEQTARRFGVSGHVRLNTAITEARFDETALVWVLATADGETFRARHVISAAGPLRVPNIPAIPGMDEFAGPVFHSARWRHDVELAGKTIAMIGSAASAVQIAPAIAGEVGHLHIFQRTPNYIVPRRQKRYSAAQKARWRRFPVLLRLRRAWMRISRDVFSFRAFRKNSLLSRLFARNALRHMREIIHDPDLRKKLTPDYPLGCKRILLSDDYYQTLLRPNVSLVTDGIERITREGLRTKAGHSIDADAIVLATGFEATNFLEGLDVFGRGGQSLHERFETRLSAYRGVSYPGFPNFYTILGPNTGLGHSSMILIIEAQANYIRRCVERAGKDALDVREEAERRYTEAINKAMQNMVWASNCQSWYKSKDGAIPTLWPHSTAAFSRLMARPDFGDYTVLDARAHA